MKPQKIIKSKIFERSDHLKAPAARRSQAIFVGYKESCFKIDYCSIYYLPDIAATIFWDWIALYVGVKFKGSFVIIQMRDFKALKNHLMNSNNNGDQEIFKRPL